MRTYLFPIPSKKTDDVNWTKPLNNYLLSIYGNTSEYQEDLTQFNKLRQDIRGVHADLTGIRLYFKYYSQLELLDLRISFTTVNRHKKITFNWYDAFDQLSEHKQYALPFEKACILFNLGTILSKYAIHQYELSQSSNENADSLFKEAVQYFQQLAGIYQFLNENFLHAPSPDLSLSTVNFLKNINLAQSQEIFNLKVISGDLDQSKNSLISKLCRSTSNYYDDCFNCVSHLLNHHENSVGPSSTYAIVEDGLDDEDEEDSDSKPTDEYDPDSQANSVPDNKVTAQIDSLWIAIIQFKCYYYKSLAFYFHGLQLETLRKYGESIAYLNKSQEIISEIPSALLLKIGKAGISGTYELLDNYKYHKDAVLIKLKDLNKDNDLIYHGIVPSTVTLADIKPMDSAKIIPINKIPIFNEINESNYSNFLNNVVPINIHELLSYYSEEKLQLLRNELDEVDVSNEELSLVLEYLKMPKALINLKEIVNNKKINEEEKKLGIDPSIAEKVDKIHFGFNLDQSNKSQIEQLREQAMGLISETDSLIGVNATFFKYKDDLIKVKKWLYDASNSDTKLFGLINNEHQYLYGVLGQGSKSSDFKQLFHLDSKAETKKPSQNEVSLLDIDDRELNREEDEQTRIEQEIKLIEDTLHDLNVIKTNKQKLIETFKKEIHNDDISDILILNCKIKSTSEIKSLIFPEELKKFRPYSDELDKLIGKQNEYVENLKVRWNQLNKNPKVQEVQSLNQFQNDLVKSQTDKINTFYSNNWQPYHEGLKKGVEIYKQLVQYVEGIKIKLINDQQQQQQQLMRGSSITDQLGKMSLNQSQIQSPNFTGQEQYTGQQYQQYPQQYSNQQYAQTQSPYYSQPPMLQPTSATGTFGNDYSRPPALPPKRPSEQSATANANLTGGSIGNQPAHPNTNIPSSNLIYDQPSTYQPNMYNFFSNGS